MLTQEHKYKDTKAILDELEASIKGDNVQPIPPAINVLACTMKVCHVSEQHIFTVSDANEKVHAVSLFPAPAQQVVLVVICLLQRPVLE